MIKKLMLALVVVVTLLAGLVVACAAPAPAPAPTPAPAPAPAPAQKPETIAWHVSTFGTVADQEYIGIKYFCDEVEAMSGGRITVERYPVGEPFPATEALDGVGKGMCEMAFNGGFYLAGVEAALGPICSRPGTAMDRLEQLNAFCESSEFRGIVQQVFNRHNCYHLASMTNTTTGVLSKMPVNHLADFKGLVIRSCPPRDMVFTKLGAACTYTATPEIYSALQLGTIDAVDKGNYATEFGLKLHEVTKYIVEPQFWAPENLIDIFVNMDSWNKLTPDLQAIVQGAARLQARYYAYDTSLLNAIAREKMIDYGLEVTTIPPEEMVQAYKIGPEVWDEMASQCDECAQVIEIYKKYYKQFGYSLE